MIRLVAGVARLTCPLYACVCDGWSRPGGQFEIIANALVTLIRRRQVHLRNHCSGFTQQLSRWITCSLSPRPILNQQLPEFVLPGKQVLPA